MMAEFHFSVDRSNNQARRELMLCAGAPAR
jgi:hypothetical protein